MLSEPILIRPNQGWDIKTGIDTSRVQTPLSSDAEQYAECVYHGTSRQAFGCSSGRFTVRERRSTPRTQLPLAIAGPTLVAARPRLSSSPMLGRPPGPARLGTYLKAS